MGKCITRAGGRGVEGCFHPSAASAWKLLIELGWSLGFFLFNNTYLRYDQMICVLLSFTKRIRASLGRSTCKSWWLTKVIQIRINSPYLVTKNNIVSALCTSYHQMTQYNLISWINNQVRPDIWVTYLQIRLPCLGTGSTWLGNSFSLCHSSFPLGRTSDIFRCEGFWKCLYVLQILYVFSRSRVTFTQSVLETPPLLPDLAELSLFLWVFASFKW